MHFHCYQSIYVFCCIQYNCTVCILMNIYKLQLSCEPRNNLQELKLQSLKDCLTRYSNTYCR